MVREVENFVGEFWDSEGRLADRVAVAFRLRGLFLDFDLKPVDAVILYLGFASDV